MEAATDRPKRTNGKVIGDTIIFQTLLLKELIKNNKAVIIVVAKIKNSLLWPIKLLVKGIIITGNKAIKPSKTQVPRVLKSSAEFFSFMVEFFLLVFNDEVVDGEAGLKVADDDWFIYLFLVVLVKKNGSS